MNRRLRLSAFVVLLVLLSTACGGGEDPAINTTGTVTPRATPTGEAAEEARTGDPSITIEAPGNGARIPAGSVEVRVAVSGFQVVDKLNQPPAEGEGHVHFYMDVENLPTERGRPAVSERGTYHATATTSHTWTNVTPGDHSFSAQLVNNDHTPLSPPVFRTIRVTVT